MGEGYHNYHHEFQWDYRNGVKPWQLDPSKWIIWFLSKVGLTGDLKRVPTERILLAETRETEKQLNDQISLFKETIQPPSDLVVQALSTLEELGERLGEISSELQTAAHDKIKLSRKKLNELSVEVRTVLEEVKSTNKLVLA